MKTCYKNARIVLPDASAKLSDDGKRHHLRDRLRAGCCLDGADVTADCQGMYLSPGFIDVHVHGAGGHDFMEGGEAVYTAARCHMLHGTTSIVPTTLTGSRQDLLDFVDGFNQLDLEREGCPHILGLHLEGPYFAASQAGAQNPEYLRNPQPDEYEEVLRRTDRVRRWSFAVELDGSDRFWKRFTSMA